MKMPFGKYRGTDVTQIDRNYLEWVLANTDLPERNPGVAAAIRKHLASGGIVAPSEHPTVRRMEAPTHWGYGVRGGGLFEDGVVALCRLSLVGGQIVRDRMGVTRNLSGSRRSGTVDFDEPDEDGVYEWTCSTGSIKNHSRSSQIGLLFRGSWYAVAGLPDVMAILTGQPIVIPDGEILTLEASNV